ncbi:hydrogenase subunit MbhD domain-containing protein [Ningiella sp. W23]|uniref:hydrogenase subunit MbhD domain-containing protein n=1 Tax=Ningiella sp. W23 TaxID=3023715 RepID=UPI003757FDD9
MDMLYDLVLCGLVLIVAGSIFLVKRVFTSILLFICLGLIITLCWIRLNAVDVAIAEAAIGAGLTGAMLVAAWRKLGAEESD